MLVLKKKDEGGERRKLSIKRAGRNEGNTSADQLNGKNG